MSRRSFVTFAVGLLVSWWALAAPMVTLESLVREMTDLDGLTRFPKPAYTCKQFSSYDRRSTDPAVLTDENWFANDDRGRHLRVEERGGAKEWVMMDADGPGAIVRIWSANPNDAGLIRVYMDGAADPAIEMPMTEMLGGEARAFPSPIAGERSRGWNCHLPLPYAKHCKVTTSERNFYYQVNYRTYAPGTTVQTYSTQAAQAQGPLIREVAERLAQPDQFSFAPSVSDRTFNEELAPGAVMAASLEGPGAVRRLALKASAENIEGALRGCLLEIAFDGETAPSVQAPLGDFFGTAPGANVYRSLPSGVNEEGVMYCHWVMPFARSAEIRLTNHSDQPVQVVGELLHGPYEWTADSMHFHAKWRAEHPIPTRPRQDWTYLDCTGKGVFVGDMLHVTNPVKHWWGEGDEKIYVDGEAFPSHFGTGSEDYYGYAWCCPDVFTHAYHNQPRCDGPGNYGQTCVSRYHIIDNIPFTESFRFDMEVWHWADCEVAMAATSYWYAQPGGSDTFAAPKPEDLVVIEPTPLPQPKRVQGALEGEGLERLPHSGGMVQTQESSGWNWSGEQQVWWTYCRPGDTLVLQFPVEKAGRYEVRAVFTKAVDYGVARLYINGRPTGDPIDFFNDGVVTTGELSLGAHDLVEGKNKLTVEMVGKNDKAVPSYMFGLDYLLLKAAE